MDKVTKSFPGMSIGQSIPAMKRRRLMKKPKKLGEWRDSVAKYVLLNSVMSFFNLISFKEF